MTFGSSGEGGSGQEQFRRGRGRAGAVLEREGQGRSSTRNVWSGQQQARVGIVIA